VAPVEITDATIEALAALAPLAPSSAALPVHRSGASSRFGRPNADRLFRHRLPSWPCPAGQPLPIPRRFEEMGVRRYGFHGLSFEFIARRLAEISPALPAKRTVAAHLVPAPAFAPCAMAEASTPRWGSRHSTD